MQLIRLKEVLQRMDAGEEFSIAFVTCDRTRKTAGELIEIARAVKNTHKFQGHSNGASIPADKPVKLLLSDPDHLRNNTRNIRIVDSKEIRKVSIYLITRFNGIKVHW